MLDHFENRCSEGGQSIVPRGTLTPGGERNPDAQRVSAGRLAVPARRGSEARVFLQQLDVRSARALLRRLGRQVGGLIGDELEDVARVSLGDTLEMAAAQDG